MKQSKYLVDGLKSHISTRLIFVILCLSLCCYDFDIRLDFHPTIVQIIVQHPFLVLTILFKNGVLSFRAFDPPFPIFSPLHPNVSLQILPLCLSIYLPSIWIISIYLIFNIHVSIPEFLESERSSHLDKIFSKT